MTPQEALAELLGRLGASGGAPVHVTADELDGWPQDAVAAMKQRKLLVKASPAHSAICPGCERACTMPVHVIPNPPHVPNAFVACDKREDIGRVPVSIAALERWQTSGGALAQAIARLLGFDQPVQTASSGHSWIIGVLKGNKHSRHVTLSSNGALELAVGSLNVPAGEVLRIDGFKFTIDSMRLGRLADSSAADGDVTESADARSLRIKNRRDELIAQGQRGFLKTIAAEEGVSTSRLKQILTRKAAATTPDSLGHKRRG